MKRRKREPKPEAVLFGRGRMLQVQSPDDFKPCIVCGKKTRAEKFVDGRWQPCCFLVHTIEELARSSEK